MIEIKCGFGILSKSLPILLYNILDYMRYLLFWSFTTNISLINDINFKTLLFLMNSWSLEYSQEFPLTKFPGICTYH